MFVILEAALIVDRIECTLHAGNIFNMLNMPTVDTRALIFTNCLELAKMHTYDPVNLPQTES